ncbi:Glyoxylate/hydroxypyruvate reductase B [Ralstonia mannitolilytica]|uniref:2-hydroxyacid dehydrogenase n=1 Tax=Ralstonia mannitolilytica TaxID=105219 RepID=UPI0007B0224D|nr:D-glycerate dehydrogenase [Ralstonia mannitolilytica]ANA34395.1 2-hydroxyacid dehydrogenase [Ralstonia mannitolilytica]CAJ0680611.1 Glyoxylate/hydroxypyruvate reductase B [Ralstonia mannitolilytica]CAJ0741067.1 Glyoxylate/hydroxypyruvate reductase B [Ralstonia mannitolilytica]CAJ0774713.1 Glyoxylate/hydroxypyruvate reductase B [Ralstonia mannitolilytica]CAJ0851367.1 Glyoxylate/hydroxypyruvate reductase B [Ralstonia mannitolilytica]
MKPGILVTRALFPEVLERLREIFDVVDNQADAVFPPEALAERLQGRVGLLANAADTIDADLIARVPTLRAVANMAVGYNNLDLPAMTRAGILATNTPDILTETTADFGWALLMAAARRVSESERWLRAGHWKRWTYDMFLGAEVHGTTLGILGMGRIGQALARRASGFSMRVIYHNRSRLAPEIEQETRATYVSKEALLRQADHLVLVLPYSPESHHAIGAAELAQMKPSATLVNLARGGIVDDAALAQALAEKRIFAAGLDVYEGEPKVHPALLEAEHVALTPHIASATHGTRLGMANLAADNLIAALGFGPHAGQPPNLLNPDALAVRRTSA